MGDAMDPEPGDYSIYIKCPKCGSEDVVVEEDENGYYSVLKCNKCGYSKKGNKEDDKKVLNEED